MSEYVNCSQALSFLTLPRTGLLYDVVGALILAWESLHRSAEAIRHDSSLFWRAGIIVRADITTGVDTQIGFGLLALGFVLQLTAGTSIEQLDWVAWLLLIALVSFLSFYFAWLRRWMITRGITRIGPLE